MNKRVIYVLCAILVLVAGFFLVRGIISSNEDPNLGQTQKSNEGTYWKTAGFDGIELEYGEFWSDVFLWEDGTGYFRFSQATPASNYYGMYDVESCDWSLGEGGLLTLYKSGTNSVLYTGSIENDVLMLNYDGYIMETIRMEQAQMPPYGAHFTVLDLYGTWQMVAYTDKSSGYHTAEELGRYFASEITLDQVISNHYWLADPSRGIAEIFHTMDIGYYDDYAWHPISEGPIWDGNLNQAWHVEITRSGNSNVHFYATYADGKLFFKKVDDNNPNSFPYSFTAEYEYVGYREELGENSVVDAINKKFGLTAYALVLENYEYAVNSVGDKGTIADNVVSYLESNVKISDSDMSRELYYSIEEPLYGGEKMGYAVRDINLDGVPELFIISDEGYGGNYAIKSVYTLNNGDPSLVGAYWSRKRCMVDSDGVFYIEGSSGADDSTLGTYRLNSTAMGLQKVTGSYRPFYPMIPISEAGLLFTPFVVSTGGSSSNSGQAQVDDVAYAFSTVVGYRGKVYSIFASPEIPNTIGLSGSTKLTPLPAAIGKAMELEGRYIYSFTICQDKIYYVAGIAGEQPIPGVIYRCNLDGSGNERLAEGVIDYKAYYPRICVHDGSLYYEMRVNDNYTVIKMDLNTFARKEVVFFPYQMMASNATDNGDTYSFGGRTIYRNDERTGTLVPVISLTVSYGEVDQNGDGFVLDVVDEEIYYYTLGEAYKSVNLYRVNINGGKSEHLASWFLP